MSIGLRSFFFTIFRTVMQRILFVSYFDHARMGGQQSMLDLIRHLDRSRFTPLLLCPNRGELSEQAERLGCCVFTMPRYAIKPKNFSPLVQMVRAAMHLFVQQHIDIVHPDHERDAFVFGLAARLAGIPMIWHVRISQRTSLDGLNARLASAVISVSNGVQQQRFTHLHHRPQNGFKKEPQPASAPSPIPALAARTAHSKHYTIYNGVDCEQFTPVQDKASHRRALGLPTERRILGFVGQVKEGKGVFDVVRALGMMKTSHPTLLPLTLIIGSALDDSEQERLQKMIAEHDVQRDVVLLGQRQRIWEWMQAMDALILPSHEGIEGMGRVLAEAQACGVATIGSDITGVREVVGGGVGITIPPNSPVSIVAALAHLFAHPDELERLQIAGREAALLKYESTLHSYHVERVYDEVCDDARNTPRIDKPLIDKPRMAAGEDAHKRIHHRGMGELHETALLTA